MAAYRRVYDSRHLQADAKNRDQPRNPTLDSRVWATFTFYQCEAPACTSNASVRYDMVHVDELQH